jgi:hypothetical protein
MTERAHVIDDGVDVVPVRCDRRERVRVAWLARRRDESSLSILGEIARVVHRRRTRRSAVAGGVHREDVEAGARQERHPAVVLVRHIERDFGGRSRAVHEQHDAVAERRGAQRRAGLHALADVDLRRLPRDGGYGRLHPHVVIDREQLLAIVTGDGDSDERNEGDDDREHTFHRSLTLQLVSGRVGKWVSRKTRIYRLPITNSPTAHFFMDGCT